MHGLLHQCDPTFDRYRMDIFTVWLQRFPYKDHRMLSVNAREFLQLPCSAAYPPFHAWTCITVTVAPDFTSSSLFQLAYLCTSGSGLLLHPEFNFLNDFVYLFKWTLYLDLVFLVLLPHAVSSFLLDFDYYQFCKLVVYCHPECLRALSVTLINFSLDAGLAAVQIS